MVKVIADRLAEALTEQLHEKVRRYIWGYASKEDSEFMRISRAPFKRKEKPLFAVSI